MKFYCILILTFFLSISCTEKVNLEKLNYPIETTKVAMYELYLASDALNNREPSIQDSLRELYRSQIETIHNLDLDLVEEDILEIKKDVKLYQKIHAEVSDSLVSLEKRILKKKEPKKPD